MRPTVPMRSGVRLAKVGRAEGLGASICSISAVQSSNSTAYRPSRRARGLARQILPQRAAAAAEIVDPPRIADLHQNEEDRRVLGRRLVREGNGGDGPGASDLLDLDLEGF